MLMAGLRQRFPALGLSLGPRAEAVRAEARAIDLARANIERDVRRRAAHAFADYLEASERVRLHAAHIDLAKRIVSAARARAEAGGPLGDVAQAEVDLAAITVEHEEARLRREGARSQIDALLGRPVDAELPDPALPTLTVPAWPLARIIEHAKTSRPEVQIARAEASANEARRSAAKREWIWPTVSAAALYFAPTSATSTSGAGVSVAVELPWLWGERKARFDAAALERSASITRAEGAELDVATEVASAWREAAAAALRVRAYDEQVLPASRKALDVAFAGYTSARTDLPVLLLASRSLIDAELARLIAAVTLEHALAELDAAAGLPVPRQPLAQWRMP
jgi:outer membrane protein TolC